MLKKPGGLGATAPPVPKSRISHISQPRNTARRHSRGQHLRLHRRRQRGKHQHDTGPGEPQGGGRNRTGVCDGLPVRTLSTGTARGNPSGGPLLRQVRLACHADRFSGRRCADLWPRARTDHAPELCLRENIRGLRPPLRLLRHPTHDRTPHQPPHGGNPAGSDGAGEPRRPRISGHRAGADLLRSGPLRLSAHCRAGGGDGPHSRRGMDTPALRLSQRLPPGPAPRDARERQCVQIPRHRAPTYQ